MIQKKFTAFRNLSSLVTLDKAHKKDGRNLQFDDLSILSNGSVVFSNDSIVWVGLEENFPDEYEANCKSHFFPGFTLLPEIVDSHTHLVFGGDRSKEYSQRLNGATYEEIANSGGGIVSTMKETNSLPIHKLFELAKERIKTLASYGVGTIEIKSGYGLNYQKEKELSELIFDLKKHFQPKIQIHNTFMAAHAIPADFSSSSEYVTKVVLPLFKELATNKIIDSVDIFHEKGYFSNEDVRRIFLMAQEFNIHRKIHADEFNDNDGLKLAMEFKCLSADHLLMSNDNAILNLANSSTVATLLPGTALFLGKPLPRARKFLDGGAKVAIASDYNPGSCHIDNILLIASLASPLLKLNIAELWSAITLNAAHSLGLYSQGAIVEGLKPRFSLFHASELNQITYHIGKNLAYSILEV